MSTIQEERSAYERNPYFKGHIFSNFSPFYTALTLCSILIIGIIVLNIVLGCCSKHRKYWQDRHTGNRWIVSLWTSTPHNQPPLDFTELKDVAYFNRLQPQVQQIYPEDIEAQHEHAGGHGHHYQQQQFHHQHPGRSFLPYRQGHGEEYVELQKRESEI